MNNFRILLLVLVVLSAAAMSVNAADLRLRLTFDNVIRDDSLVNPLSLAGLEKVGGAANFNQTNFKVGNASMIFDGIDDYINISGYNLSSKLNISGDMTVTAWVNLESNTIYNHFYGFQGVGGACNESDCGMVLGTWDQSGRLSGAIATDATTRVSIVNNVNVPMDENSQSSGRFYFVMWRYDSVSDNLILGVNRSDGARVFAAGATANFFPGGGKLRIGYTGTSQDVYSAITLDELCVWSGNLSDADLDTLYNNSFGAPCSVIETVPTEEAQIVVTAADFYDGAPVNNFTVQVSNATNVLTNSTTSGEVRFGNLANLTTYTVNFTSNDSGGYFNQSTSVFVNLTTNVNLLPFQSIVTFNAQQIFTQQAISGVNVSLPSQSNTSTTSQVTLYPRAGSYSVNGNATGHFNVSTPFTVNALDNISVDLEFHNALANLTVLDLTSNSSISVGFLLNVSPVNYSTSVLLNSSGLSALTNIPLLNNFNFTFRVLPDDTFTNATSIFNITQTYNNFTMGVRVLNSVNVEVYRETTNTILNLTGTNETIFLDFINLNDLTQSVNLTTKNGTLFTVLSTGSYEVRYRSTGFNQRSAFFTLDAENAADLDLYLLNDTLSTLVVVTITDENDDPLNGSILKLLRFFISEGQFKTVEESRANFNGQAPINLILNEQDYRFLVEKDGQVIFSSGTDTKVTTTDLRIQVPLGPATFQTVVGLRGVFTTLTESVAGNSTITYSYLDTVGFLKGGCLKVDEITLSGTNNICNICSGSGTSTLVCSVNSTRQVVATGLVNTTINSTVVTDTLTRSFNAALATFGVVGPFLTLLVFLAVVLSSAIRPEIALIMGVIALAASLALGMFSIGIGTLLALVIVAVIIMFKSDTMR